MITRSAPAGLLATALMAATAPTADAQVPVPALASAYAAAFAESCMSAFPNLDAVARNAAHAGWIETSMRPLGPVPAQLAAALPRVFRRGGMTLFLVKPGAGEISASCQVAGVGENEVSSDEIVAAVGPLFVGVAPVAEKAKASEGATWTIGARRDVFAGVKKSGRTKTLTLVVRDKR